VFQTNVIDTVDLSLQTDYWSKFNYYFQYYNTDRVKGEGVSSAIVLGGTVTVFTGTAEGGVSSRLTIGEYPTPQSMGIDNDAVQSIRKQQWTSCSSSGRFDDLLTQA